MFPRTKPMQHHFIKEIICLAREASNNFLVWNHTYFQYQMSHFSILLEYFYTITLIKPRKARSCYGQRRLRSTRLWLAEFMLLLSPPACFCLFSSLSLKIIIPPFSVVHRIIFDHKSGKESRKHSAGAACVTVVTDSPLAPHLPHWHGPKLHIHTQWGFKALTEANIQHHHYPPLNVYNLREVNSNKVMGCRIKGKSNRKFPLSWIFLAQLLNKLLKKSEKQTKSSYFVSFEQ